MFGRTQDRGPVRLGEGSRDTGEVGIVLWSVSWGGRPETGEKKGVRPRPSRTDRRVHRSDLLARVVPPR